MSKVVVYILDRLVWMLLITAFTTQALQMAGIIQSPKGYQGITHSKGEEYSFQLSVGETDGRLKRETQDRSPFIDSLFNNQIGDQGYYFYRNEPTKNSRPAFRSFRDYATRRYNKNSSVTTTRPTTELAKKLVQQDVV